MLHETLDMSVVMGVVLAFVVGFVIPFVFYKSKQKSFGGEASPEVSARLEYYEKQLIDMRLRLDSILYVERGVGDVTVPDPEKQDSVTTPTPSPKKQNKTIEEGVEERVLELIADGNVTSRDIQITIKRTREHTARLLKRLFEEGFVERSAKTKPYTYTITEKGRRRLE